MSASENKMLSLMAQKLGLHDSIQLLEKAQEFLRLLSIKSVGNNSIALNDYAKSIICLDLASSTLGASFDSETALKLSGQKKNAYLNSLRTIEKLLDIARPITVHELCVQLGVTGVTDKAVMLYKKFKESHNTTDTSLPQYAAMAVYQACRLDKVKVTRSKVIAFSHLKSSQWSVLEADWTKWVDIVAQTLQNCINSQINTNSEIGTKCKEAESFNNEKSTDEETEVITEDYVTWRKRILKAAYADIDEAFIDYN